MTQTRKSFPIIFDISERTFCCCDTVHELHSVIKLSSFKHQLTNRDIELIHDGKSYLVHSHAEDFKVKVDISQLNLDGLSITGNCYLLNESSSSQTGFKTIIDVANYLETEFSINKKIDAISIDYFSDESSSNSETQVQNKKTLAYSKDPIEIKLENLHGNRKRRAVYSESRKIEAKNLKPNECKSLFEKKVVYRRRLKDTRYKLKIAKTVAEKKSTENKELKTQVANLTKKINRYESELNLVSK